jgi:hypothetical protein
MGNNASGSALGKNLAALGGAAVGGALGYWGFLWLIERGWLGLILPGALIGLGASVVRNRSIWVAVVCGSAAVLLALFAYHRAIVLESLIFSPFPKEEGFGQFLLHVGDLPTLTMVLVVVGALVAFWVPFQHRTVRSM